jgi:hypothetical protein
MQKTEGIKMFYTYTKDPIGVFVEKDHGNWFEYSVNDDMDQITCYQFPHKVWVGGQGVCGDQGYRYATVKKTVAYIVIDEDDCGEPVIEKWHLKKNTQYAA